MNTKLIVKDNVLINSSYNLSLVEQRLIILAIASARENKQVIDANTIIKIHASDYESTFNVERQASYMALKDACVNLFERRFTFDNLLPNNKIERVTSRWISRIAYIDSQATVSLCFSPDVIPKISRLESHFTSYDIEQVSGLSSRYAVRLYELLIAWRSTGKTPMFELHNFKTQLGVIQTEYPRVEIFKSRVLDLAVNQINEQTDIIVKYEQIKQGRIIIGFKFTFKIKTPKQLQKQNGGIKKEVSIQKMQRYSLSGLELINFKKLKEVMPQITENDIYDIAEKNNESIGITIQRMLPLNNLLPDFIKQSIEDGEVRDVNTVDMFKRQ